MRRLISTSIALGVLGFGGLAAASGTAHGDDPIPPTPTKQCYLQVDTDYRTADGIGVPGLAATPAGAVATMLADLAPSTLLDDVLRRDLLERAEPAIQAADEELWTTVEDGQIRAQFKIERLSAEQGWRVTKEGIALDDTAC